MDTRYAALLDQRAALVQEGEAIFTLAAAEGNRALTAEEQSRDDAINAQLQALAPEIAREEARRARLLSVAAPHDAGHHFGSGITNVNDRSAGKPWDADGAPGFGSFLQAVYRAQTGQGTDARLFQAAAQGAGEAIGADGGFLVPKQFVDDIKLRMHGGQILSRVNKKTLTVGNSIELTTVDETSRATGSRHGGVQAYWVDEGTSVTPSRPKFGKQEWKPRKIMAIGYATDELLADTSLLESIMLDAFADELLFMAEDAVIEGTGAGMPQGILNSNALISVAKESGQANTTLVYENIVNMWARLWAPSRANAVWLMNQDVEPQLGTMSLVVGTGGVPVYMPASGISGAPYSTLFGRPIIPTEYNATLGTVGDILLADLDQYWLFDKGDPQRATSMHVAFTTDEMAFRVTYRVDGHPRWKTPLTPFKGSNTLSPFVALAAR